MRSWNSWRTTLATACLASALTGCGGSGGDASTEVVDLSDPGFGGPSAPAPAPAPAPEAAPNAGAPVPIGGQPAPALGFRPPEDATAPAVANAPEAAGQPAPGVALGSETPASAPAEPTPTETAAPGLAAATSGAEADRKDESFALNEMLAASNAAATTPPPASAGANPTPGPGGPGGLGIGVESGSRRGSGDMSSVGYGPGYPGMEGSSSYGGAVNGSTPGTGSSGYPGMQTSGAGLSMNEGGGALGGPGFGGSIGGGSNEPGDFTNPKSAAESFLKAAEARNPQRLAEAVALRAELEASTEDKKKIFQAIRQMALTPEELEQIGSEFEGYQVNGANQVRSSGSMGIIIGKTGENGSQLTRTLYMRREKAGWKVKDVTGVREFKQLGGRVRNNRNNN